MPISTFPLRNLGRNGPAVPAIGTGLMGLSSHGTYGAIPNDDERFALLDRAYEIGATFWDTSDLYGDCEELIGRWFKKTGKRDQIFLASKFGYVRGSKTLEMDTSAAYTRKACEKSLEALGVDSIDLYYVHNVNRDTPIEETMRALNELQAEGKIKHIGLSACSSSTVRRACKVSKVEVFQPEYSVFMRDIEGPEGTNLLAVCRELGVSLVIASPLGRGILTSTFKDAAVPVDEKDRRYTMMPRFQKENVDQNVNSVQKFSDIAAKKGCTPSQLALAWLLKQGDDIIPIPGTRKIKYLEENWESQGMQLSDEEERDIRAVADAFPMAGGMVPDAYKSFIYQDTKEESA